VVVGCARKAERERGLTGKGDWRRQTGPTGQREGKRERERACMDAGGRWQVGSTCQTTQARARGLAGPTGLN
jgi:hypothetical protein